MLMLGPRKVAALPTIYQSYRPIEEYLDFLDQAGCAPANPALIRPIDALAFNLLLALAPSRPTVMDLAGDLSGGVSTLLGRSQPRVRKVIGVRRSTPPGTPDSVETLENYLASCVDPISLAPFAEAAGDDALSTAAKELSGAACPLVLLPTAGETPETLSRKTANWLGLRREMIVVLLPLGQAGQCEHLASLVAACADESPHRLSLLRDQTPAFHDCQMGLVYDRKHPFLPHLLIRLRQMFTGNFNFLNLTKSACEAAIRAELVEPGIKAKQAEEALKAKQTEEALKATEARLAQQVESERKALEAHKAWREEQERNAWEAHKAWHAENDRRRLEAEKAWEVEAARRHQEWTAFAEAAWQARQGEEAARHQEYLARQEAQRYRYELDRVTGSLAFRVARRLSGLRGILVPNASVRYWVLARCVHALRIWKASGLRGLAARTAKKLNPLKKRPA